MGGGLAFQDVKNPRVMVQCGEHGSRGILEITDVVFTTKGPGNVFEVYGRIIEGALTIVCWHDSSWRDRR